MDWLLADLRKASRTMIDWWMLRIVVAWAVLMWPFWLLLIEKATA
jgi:hypothetical protein